MSATARTPITRHLTLVALLVAAGVFSLRLFETLQPAPAPAQIGSLQERETTALLETVAGPGNIRVSLQAGVEQRWLVLVNGPADAEQTRQIETILAASTGFRAGIDELTISQFEFAPAEHAAIPYRGALELTGLGLIVVILSGLALWPARQEEEHKPALAAPAPLTAKPMPETVRHLAVTEPSIEQASTMAERHPDDTVRLLRSWMSNKNGTSA